MMYVLSNNFVYSSLYENDKTDNEQKHSLGMGYKRRFSQTLMNVYLNIERK